MQLSNITISLYICIATYLQTSKINCIHFVVNCSSLSNPNNGIISCSLGNDGVPSYEDTCSFTCNTGYELTGSDTIGPVRVIEAGVVLM